MSDSCAIDCRAVKPCSTWMPWLVCLSAGLFFLYEFFQLNLFDVINQPLRDEFNIDAAQLSWMSSTYLWANVLFLLPAGLILDRFSTRKVILSAMAVCVLGTLGFASTNVFAWAAFFHSITGIGNAFCFLSCVVLISRWFPPRRQALVVGCIVTMAFIGGMMAHTPLACLCNQYGWRNALWIDAGVGALIFGWILVVVKDKPKIDLSTDVTYLLIVFPTSSFSSLLSADENIYRMNQLSINAAAGYLGGEANEYVYTGNGRKLSQLDWKIEGATIIKGEINFDFLPWLTANANGWTTIETGNALMDDYDWLNPAQSNFTHWSHHPDTELNYANDLDLNIRGWFLQNQHYKLGTTAGYKQSSFDFVAIGGCYQYDNGLNTGCFPENERCIGYQQTFDTVYFGLTGKYLMNNFEFNATLKVSPWVKANDTDHHYARDITFTESGDNSMFAAISVTAGYYVTQYTTLFFEAAYNQFSNGKANTWIDDHETGIFRIPGGAGIGNNNYILALGLQYTPHSV